MGDRPGGTAAAAAELKAHRGAIEYDLLTLAGLTTEDVGGGLTWPALWSFITHLPPSSAWYRETRPEEAAWANGYRLAGILADLYDLLAAVHTKEGRTPPRYPRPGDKDENVQRFGADPIPISEFERWWNDPRR